jgi:hypothetical protein
MESEKLFWIISKVFEFLEKSVVVETQKLLEVKHSLLSAMFGLVVIS